MAVVCGNSHEVYCSGIRTSFLTAFAASTLLLWNIEEPAAFTVAKPQWKFSSVCTLRRLLLVEFRVRKSFQSVCLGSFFASHGLLRLCELFQLHSLLAIELTSHWSTKFVPLTVKFRFASVCITFDSTYIVVICSETVRIALSASDWICKSLNRQFPTSPYSSARSCFCSNYFVAYCVIISLLN